MLGHTRDVRTMKERSADYARDFHRPEHEDGSDFEEKPPSSSGVAEEEQEVQPPRKAPSPAAASYQMEHHECVWASRRKRTTCTM